MEAASRSRSDQDENVMRNESLSIFQSVQRDLLMLVSRVARRRDTSFAFRITSVSRDKSIVDRWWFIWRFSELMAHCQTPLSLSSAAKSHRLVTKRLVIISRRLSLVLSAPTRESLLAIFTLRAHSLYIATGIFIFILEGIVFLPEFFNLNCKSRHWIRVEAYVQFLKNISRLENIHVLHVYQRTTGDC